MALTAITGAASAKSINIEVQGTATQTMYTVPSGKKFIGKMWTNGSSYFGRINNVNMRHPFVHTSGMKPLLDITLYAGDIVQASATAADHTTLHGTEIDA